LPEIHQAVLLLRELEGMSYQEIAKALRVKKGTVKSRLFHARRSMQEHLNRLMREATGAIAAEKKS
jgi:RNA polymerase sigma-70 factor (ECF subfamily)